MLKIKNAIEPENITNHVVYKNNLKVNILT